MDTTICVRHVKPRPCKITVLCPCFRGCWLAWSGVQHTQDSRHKYFLHGLINVAITKHVPKPPVPKDGGEELPNTRCQSNGPKVG